MNDATVRSAVEVREGLARADQMALVWTFARGGTLDLRFPVAIGENTGRNAGNGEGARAPHPDRHPWLSGDDWFVDATDRLVDAMAPGSAIIIGLDHQRDRTPTFGVQVESPHTEDELDEMPGLRRIERRAGELAWRIPAKPPFGARIMVTSNDLAVHLRWHHLGQAVLLTHRRSDGWHAADMILMPERNLRVSDSDLLRRDRQIIHALDRLLGGGRIDLQAEIHSASRRNEEIRVVIGAGGVLHPRPSEVA